MKKSLRNSLFLVCATIAFQTNAQSVISNIILPHANDVFQYSRDRDGIPGVVTAAGASAQSWDFSGFHQDTVVIDTIHAGSSPNFPTANISATIGGLPVMIDVTSTQERVLGSEFNIGGSNLPVVFNTPVVELFAPIHYNNNSHSAGSFSYTINPASIPQLDTLLVHNLPANLNVDSLRLRVNLNVDLHADAWGSMQVPSGTYDVLRVRRDQYVTIGIDLHIITFFGGLWIDPTQFGVTLPFPTGTDTTKQYEFYSPLAKEAVCVLYTTPRTDSVTRADYRTLTQPNVAVQNVFNNSKLVSLSPNPATTFVNINISQLAAGEYHVSVVDALGRKQADLGQIHQQSGDIMLDISKVPAGYSWLELQDNNGTPVVIKALIKQ